MNRVRGVIAGLAVVGAVAAGCVDGVREGAVWRYENLDGTNATGGNGRMTSPNGGAPSVAVLGNEQFVFSSAPIASKSVLRLAHFSAGAWSFITLDGPGSTVPGHAEYPLDYQTAPVVYNGQVHVFYGINQPEGVSLRHAWLDAGTWKFEYLDGPAAPAGNGRTTNEIQSYLSAAATPAGILVAYGDNINDRLRVAQYTVATGWQMSDVDGPGVLFADATDGEIRYERAVVAMGDAFHVIYSDEANDTLGHAWLSDGIWRRETVDGLGGANGRIDAEVGEWATAVVYQGQLHAFYEGETTPGGIGLRHAWLDAGTWKAETLDGPGSPGGSGRVATDAAYHAAAVAEGKNLRVYYTDDDTRFMREALFNGTAWTFQTIDGDSTVGGRVMADLDNYAAVRFSDRGVHLYYLDYTSKTLRHAWLS